MVKILIGTAGFEYHDWIGTFYPKRLDKALHLEYFSQFFNIVEINSTFYNLPSESMVINWYNRVPENFRFIVKVWQEITHKLGDFEHNSRVIDFFERMRFLKDKIRAILLQFPPWFKYSEKYLNLLIQLLSEVPKEYSYIIELRDNSWFDPEITHNFIDGDNFILGTTYKPGIIPFYLNNQKSYYIRVIGDRELTIFNRIQRDQKIALESLIKSVQKLRESTDINEILIIVNNHFQGFAPESVNNLKKKFGLQYNIFTTQRSISDYLK